MQMAKELTLIQKRTSLLSSTPLLPHAIPPFLPSPLFSCPLLYHTRLRSSEATVTEHRARRTSNGPAKAISYKSAVSLNTFSSPWGTRRNMGLVYICAGHKGQNFDRHSETLTFSTQGEVFDQKFRLCASKQKVLAVPVLERDLVFPTRFWDTAIYFCDILFNNTFFFNYKKKKILSHALPCSPPLQCYIYFKYMLLAIQ